MEAFGNLAGGSNSTDSPFANLMQMMKLLGSPDEEVVPIWSSAAAFGTRRREGLDEVGTLELRIVPPTGNSPRAYLRLICGGVPIAMRPTELVELESAINRWHSSDQLVGEMPNGEMVTGTVQDIYKAAQGLEEQARGEAALNRFMG